MEIIHAIESSASQANTPDSLLGYGLPDFGKALFMVQGIDPVRLDKESFFRVYPNPFTDKLTIDFYSHDRQDIVIDLLSATGETLHSQSAKVGYTSLNVIEINEYQHLPNGIYFLRITTEKERHQQRIVKMTE